ncbi:hypothetical protein [Croceivirga thetidis]|uniref:Sugar transporter n=1 Tax=Croceivirga thetidis TaxID=2721623 RepID=A0ABX1GTZ4_9FLAO|nr:hypothetical protein [Croceivirga thetidis]NKI33429.1 hypothetical protein [Croceivirga thetidis]
MSSSTVKPPVWFWVVSVLALLWNLVGVASYLMDAYISIEQLEAMTQEMRELYEGRPAWVTACFAIAVFGGTLASIALVLRKKWARPVFIISLIAAIAQFVHWLFMTNSPDVYGAEVYVMPILVVLFGAYEIFFAKQGIEKGWLS